MELSELIESVPVIAKKAKPVNSLDIEIGCANLFNYRKNIIVPNISWGAGLHECDLLIINPLTLYATEIEIKVSISDFKNDFKKKHNHNSNKIRYLYFAIPEFMYDKCVELLSENIGIIIYDLGICKYKRFAKKNIYAIKWSETDIINIGRLGCMRIWNLKQKLKKNDKNHKK